MHSRMFEWSYEPIERDTRATEDDFYEDFCVGVADWICSRNEEERKDDIEWLQSYLTEAFPDHVICEEETVTFKQGFAEALSEQKLAEIRGILNEDKPYQEIWWRLREAVNGEYGGFYFYETNSHWENQTSFLARIEEGKTLHIGATFDYHF